MKINNEITVAILKPREIFYAWVIDVILALKGRRSVDLEKIASGSTVLMIPHDPSSEEFTLFLTGHLYDILKSEFSRWTTDETLWPSRFDIDMLMQYFELEVHHTVVDYR